MLVIYLAPLPRGFLFGLGTLGPFRFSLSGPMLRPRLRNLANEPLEAWPCIITATATKNRGARSPINCTQLPQRRSC